MEFKAFFVVALLFFIMIVPFVSATPARDTAVRVQALLDKKIPYTIELTEAQMIAAGFDAANLTNRGTYKIVVKSAQYNPGEETIVLHLNAWRNGQSVKINNPVHFYIPWEGGITGANANAQLQNYIFMLVQVIDGLPLGQPVNDDTAVIYTAGVSDGEAYKTNQNVAYSSIRTNTPDTVSNTAQSMYTSIGASTTSNQFKFLERSMLHFNTSVIGSGNASTSATLSVYSVAEYHQLGYTTYTITGFTPIIPGTVTIGDWLNFTSTAYSDDNINGSAWSGVNIINWSFNANGVSGINEAGWTTFMIRDAWDIAGTFGGTWTSAGQTYVRTSTAEASGKAPFMTIIYGVASADTTPPASNTGFANTTNCSQTNITWTKPADSDFNHTYTLWENTWVGNLSNSTQYYLKTGLTASTTYTLSTKTCDLTGNCNATWVNHSVTTSACGVAPVANFTANRTEVCTVDYIQFTDTSTNTPTTWNWSFGDGNLSTSQNPTKLFNITGLYTVNLTSNNTYGADSEVKTNYINVSVCAAPTPTPTPTPTPAPAGCTYTNLTGVWLLNSTAWTITLGNLSWGTIQNVTEGNVSYFSCIGTPTPAPTTAAPPIPNLPAPDTLDNWMEILFGNWWLWLLLLGAVLIILR